MENASLPLIDSDSHPALGSLSFGFDGTWENKLQSWVCLLSDPQQEAANAGCLPRAQE